MRVLLGCVFAAMCVALVAIPAQAADAKAKAAAKQVLSKYQDAVVTVKLVVKIRVIAQGKEVSKRESQMEITGTVLTAGGLTVVSDTSSNPGSLFGDDGADDIKTETETTDVKLLLKNGKEVGARFVLRDKDLDLAFLMPKEKDLKLTHVNLEKGPVPEVLDDLVVIYRLGKTLNREPGLFISSVEAVVKKPRTFLVTGDSGSAQSLGCPVFDSTGRPIGISVIRRSASSGGTGSLNDILSSIHSVILTAEDVMQVADQAMKEKEEK